MSKRLILIKLTLLALLIPPLTTAQKIPARGAFIPLSSYRDDPFAAASAVEHLDAARFGVDETGRLSLRNNQVWIEDEPVIFNKLNFDQLELEALAWNPWPGPLANLQGDFQFPAEARFPLFKAELGPDGKIVRREGLLVWTPNDLHLGMNTAFAAASAAKAAAEAWAGRDIAWGRNGQLSLRPHFFVDHQAFYSRAARSLFFGLLLYRLPGETETKYFELASSWEIAAHESGHALHVVLKPNSDGTDAGFKTWGESFGDQTAMWAALRNPARVQQLLEETNGDLHQSNALTRLEEAFAFFVGKGTGLRDAFHDKRVSDTREQEHDRSEVLTGAAYKLFLQIYDELKPTLGAAQAMQQAGEIMGVFLVRATDFTPENQVTLADVARAYLKVDKEFFGYRYHAALVQEFTRREIFDANAEGEWLAHEAALPQLYLLPQWSEDEVAQMLQANLDKLGLGQPFGLQLQSLTRANSGGFYRRAQTILRVQLTAGRGAGATLLDNHGILVFNASGRLIDYHSPLPGGEQTAALWGNDFVQTQAWAQLNQAYQQRLDKYGVPLALVHRPKGQWTVEARVRRGTGLGSYIEVFTPDNPHGQRRTDLVPPMPPDNRIPYAVDIPN